MNKPTAPQNIRQRILGALLLQPMSARVLSECLQMNQEVVVRSLGDLRKRAKVRIVGSVLVEKTDTYAPAYGLAGQAYTLGKFGVVPPTRKPSRNHPWVRAGKVAAEDRG